MKICENDSSGFNVEIKELMVKEVLRRQKEKKLAKLCMNKYLN